MTVFEDQRSPCAFYETGIVKRFRDVWEGGVGLENYGAGVVLGFWVGVGGELEDG